MESIQEISFLPNPKLNPSKLEYINPDLNIKVYVNLFEINLTKPLKLCQYPFATTPAIEPGDTKIRQNIYKTCSKELKSIYEECFINGDSIYGLNNITDAKNIKAKIYFKKKIYEYNIEIQPSSVERTIKTEDIQKDQLTKQFIEILIKDILHSNPKIEFFKDLFVRTDQVQQIQNSINFYPGFTTSFMETEGGNFLNVTLKNKLIQRMTILDYLNEYGYKSKQNKEEIKEYLKGKSFKTNYAKRNYRIDDILFDHNPKNQIISHDGKSKTLVQYYDDAHKIKIKDENQPLILVTKRGPQGQENNLFFIPELCSLCGLEESDVSDKNLMKDLAFYTKLEPEERIRKTKEFLELLTDPTKNPKDKNALSAKEKSDLYGIEVKPINKLFDAYYIDDTKLVGSKNKPVEQKARIPVKEKADMTKWLCFCDEYNYENAKFLFNSLKKAGKDYGLEIDKPEYISKPVNIWTEEVKNYTFGNGKKDYKFVIFLIKDDKYNENNYIKLKKHSLVKNGYVSQVVKVDTLYKKGLMAICSKILLQINSKLGGINYEINYETKFGKKILDRKIMVIGVDSSHIKGKGTGVAMVASINQKFTDFFNREEIIKDDQKNELNRCVSSFIEGACAAYLKENNNSPKNIIIYRQGVSLQQKEFLKTEIKQIDEVCKTKGISYYYILDNTKTTYKFFDKDKKMENFIIHMVVY